MNEEEFTELALKALAGEADPAERARLDTAVRGDAALAREFEALREAFRAAREAAPLVSAPEAELPAHRLEELRGSVRAAFPRRERRAPLSWWAFLRPLAIPGAALACLGLACALLFGFPGGGRVEIGLYAADPVRGGKPPSLALPPRADLRTFQADAAFAAWTASPMPRSIRARIWIDEEHDQIRVLRRESDGSLREESSPLPSSDAARTARLEELATAVSR